MPLRKRLEDIPPRTKAELHRKLVAARFGEVASIAAWLTAKGYPIEKSALSAYSRARRAEIMLESVARRPDRFALTQLASRARLDALAIAAQTGGHRGIQARAEAYLAWAFDLPG